MSVRDILRLVYHRPINVVVVEDSAIFMGQIRSCLESEYHVQGYGSVEALKADFNAAAIDILLLDVLLPGMTGLEYLKEFRQLPGCQDIPVIILTSLEDVESKRQAFSHGANDYIIKPYDEEEVRMRVRNHLELGASMQYLGIQNRLLETRVRKQTEELLRNRDAALAALAALAETRDNETGKHIHRTMGFVEKLLGLMGAEPSLESELKGVNTALLVRSAPLHDIGKVGIPDSILMKPGPLDEKERHIMEEHTILGYEAIRKAEILAGTSDFLTYAKNMCISHHENWDGSGYPHGLSGKAIPLEGRVMAICDVYDALISERVYKRPFSHAKACGILRQDRGKKFDPKLLDIFLNNHPLFLEIAKDNMDTATEVTALLAEVQFSV